MDAHPASMWIGHEFAGGRYQIKAQLGEGGMGIVYRAWDRKFGTDVVIKVPSALMLEDAEFPARFSREISLLLKLSHPQIIKITDIGERDGVPFVVMQFLPGGSLEDRQKCGPNGEVRAMPSDSLKTWLPSIAETLDFIHSQGYIHRDVKPSNILFDAHGHAYLSDFGIAKSAVTKRQADHPKTVVEPVAVIGTPEYMSKELIGDYRYDGRADQYALAVTVFEVLAGRRPFVADTVMGILVRHWSQEPPDLASLAPVPGMVAMDVRKALSKRREKRFRTCQEFAQAVINGFEPFPTFLEPEESGRTHRPVARPPKTKIPLWLTTMVFAAIWLLVLLRGPTKTPGPIVEPPGNPPGAIVEPPPGKEDAEKKNKTKTVEPPKKLTAKEYRELGDNEFQIKNYKEAVRQFSLAVNLDGSEDSYARRAEAHLYTGNYQDAVEDSTKVIAKNPQNAKAFFLRGTCYRRLRRASSGDTDLTRALELDPSIAERLKHWKKL
jgi:serine/threonine protein kinase